MNLCRVSHVGHRHRHDRKTKERAGQRGFQSSKRYELLFRSLFDFFYKVLLFLSLVSFLPVTLARVPIVQQSEICMNYSERAFLR